MSLIITDNKTVLGDIALSSLYIKVGVIYTTGNSITIRTIPYSSKAAYLLDSVNNTFKVDGINYEVTVPYDRETDGTDILLIAHDKIKEILSTDKTAERVQIDASSGEIIYDPSTNAPILETYVTTSKFTDVGNITYDF